MAWAGSLLVLVHAGIHFNAILGWLAVLAMLVNVASGLTGKFLLDRSRRRLEEARQRMRQQGLTAAELEDSTYWDSLTFDAVKQWRAVHFPITLAFAVWHWRTSWPCSCSGAGNEAPLAHGPHRRPTWRCWSRWHSSTRT